MHNIVLKTAASILSFCACFACVCHIHADDLTWDGSTGNWSTAASWLPGGFEPSSSDDAYINTGTVSVDPTRRYANMLYLGHPSGATATLNVSTEFARLSTTSGYLGYGAGSIGHALVSGRGARWENSESLYVGWEGAGTLLLDVNGYVYGHDTYIGHGAGSVGNATVTGVASLVANQLSVGHGGVGVLHVEAGSRVTSRDSFIGHQGGSNGTATVTGTDSVWTMNYSDLYVGHSGSGTLSIEAGAQVDNDTGYVGYNAGTTGSVTVSGEGSAWINSDVFAGLVLGGEGTGTLLVEAGGYVEGQDMYLGRYAGSSGTATITGAAGPQPSYLNSSDELFVGNSGEGVLNVEAGAKVQSKSGFVARNSGSTGTAIVTGADSFWRISEGLYVGLEGEGTLDIEDGGRVSSGFANIGTSTGSVGTVNLTGIGSTWEDGGLWIGSDGAGTFNIQEGASAFSEHAEIGHIQAGQATSTASVTGSGSTWEIEEWLSVGRFSEGTLTIAEGGAVESHYGVIGSEDDSTGTLRVTGDGSSWTNKELIVGNDGTGTLSIEAGGALVNTREFAIGFDYHSIGNVLVTGDGSTLTANRIDIGGNGSGAFAVEDGASASTGSAYIGKGQNSMGLGVVSGPNALWTNWSVIQVGATNGAELRIEAGGVVETGTGVIGFSDVIRVGGAMTVTGAGSQWRSRGDLTLGRDGRGVLNVEEGGHVQVGSNLYMQGSKWDSAAINFILSSPTDPLIDVARNAELWGELSVQIASDQALMFGDAFTLIEVGGARWGTFDNFAEGDLLGTFDGVDLFLTYTGGDGNDVIAYTILSTLLGDTNGDGVVDASDITAVRDNFGNTGAAGGTLFGDADHDGDVDAFDLTAVELNFGSALPLSEASNTNPIPEPGSMTMLGLAGLLIASRRRRWA